MEAMASLSIEGSNKKESVYLQSANIKYSGSVTGIPQDYNDSGEYGGISDHGIWVGEKWTTSYYYSSPSYSWTFGSTQLSGNHTFQGLRQGAENTISATLTVTVTEYWETESTKYWEEETEGYGPDGDDEDDEPDLIKTWVQKSETTYSSGRGTITATSNQASITVYTRPGIFTLYNFSEGTIIESLEGLTAEKVAAWCDHCGKYLAWKYQDNNKYDDANNCKVSGGEIISATWFNNCASICESSLSATKDITIISTNIFRSLGEAISIE